MTLYLREVLDPIATITNGFWLIYPRAITLTFGKDQIPEFYDESNTEPGWRIASETLCPAIDGQTHNFVERWSLRVRIEPDCDVCKDDKDRMEPDDDGSCRGCFRTASDYEPLGGWENEVTKPLVVEFYDNPQAKGEAVVTMEGNITYPNEKGSQWTDSGSVLARPRWWEPNLPVSNDADIPQGHTQPSDQQGLPGGS